MKSKVSKEQLNEEVKKDAKHFVQSYSTTIEIGLKFLQTSIDSRQMMISIPLALNLKIIIKQFNTFIKDTIEPEAYKRVSSQLCKLDDKLNKMVDCLSGSLERDVLPHRFFDEEYDLSLKDIKC